MVRSRSRSRSRSPRMRLDKFGRSVPAKRSRSKSRSRSRSRDRERYSSRTRRSRSPVPYRSDRYHVDNRVKDDGFPKNRTNIEDPEFLNARLFIGSLPSDKVDKQELEDLFKPYGKILGVSVHDRGFGFVQFEREEDAVRAKDAEYGTKMKGSVLDVKMAAEGRRGGGQAGRGGRGGGRGAPPPRDDGSYPPRGPPGRERSPSRSSADPYEDRYRDPYRPPPPRESLDRAGPSASHPPPPTRGADPRADPYFDPYRRGAPPPPAHDDPYRDPYREDPYRRGDPYRRDPYDDPYRDPYPRDPRDPYRDPYLPPPPPKKPMPADVQIICMNKQLQAYADGIDMRLRQSAMITDIITIPEDIQVPQMVEDAARMKFLFAIIINSQNEAHKSLTLNILHSVPQEHRNMPLEDAMKLVASSFEKYIQTQREKAAPGAAPSAAVTPTAKPVVPFLPPTADISYLLNLLADNRQLTIEELDKVLTYLKERKDKLLIAEGRKPVVESAAPQRPVPTGVQAPGAGDTSSYLQQQQQELQNKILNILNGSGSGPTPVAIPAPTQSAQGQGYGAGGSVMSTGRPQQPASAGGASNPLINFDNPSVQKALDNLIQSGPNLLKSIPSNVAQQAPARPSQYQGAAQQQAPSARGSAQAMAGYQQQAQAQPQAQQQQAQAQAGSYGSQYGYGQQQQQAAAPQTAAQPRAQAPGYGAQPRGASTGGFGVRAPQQGMRPRPY